MLFAETEPWEYRLVSGSDVVHATVAALKGLQRPEEVAARRGLTLEEVAPAGMLRARAQAGAVK